MTLGSFGKLWQKSKWRVLLAIMVGAVYGQSLLFSVLWWDDRKHLCLNPNLSPVSSHGLFEIWQKPYFGLYAPLAYTVWSLPSYLSQQAGMSCLESGGWFHALNLLLHLANVFLVFTLLGKIFPKAASFQIFLGASLFALHPLQAEAVNWISAERDLLAAFFGFASLFVLLNEMWFPALLLLLLALLSKVTAVVFPFLAIVLLWPSLRSQDRKRPWVYLSLSLAAALAMTIVTKSLQADSLLKFQSSFWQRPLIFAQDAGFYLYKLVWPWPLVPDYGRSVSALSENPIQYWPALLVIPVGLFFWMKRKRFSTSGFWLLISLLPVSGMVAFGFQEISTVADRYFYIPMFAVSLFLLESLSDRKMKSIEKAIGISFIALLAILAFHQSSYWQNDETLFKENAEVYPESPVAFGNLGHFYLEHHSLDRAEKAFTQAIQNRHDDKEGWLGLARTFEAEGRELDASKTYQDAIHQNFAGPEIYNNLAVIEYGHKEYTEADKNWHEAARLDVDYMEPRYNLGQLALLEKRPDLALEFFQQAEAIQPQDQRIQEQIESVKRMLSHEESPKASHSLE